MEAKADLKQFRPVGTDAFAVDGIGPDGKKVRHISNEAGPLIHSREGRPDGGMARQIVKAMTGPTTNTFDPWKVIPTKGRRWGSIIEMHDPSVGSSLLQIDGLKPMLRHRAVTPDGKVFIFRQGAGEIIRTTLGGEEHEWIMVEPQDVIADVVGSDLLIHEGWAVCAKQETTQESSSLLQIVELDSEAKNHLYNRTWVAGMSMHESRGRYAGLFEDTDILIYEARKVTEMAFLEGTYHAVKIEDVYGVRLW